MMSAVGVAIVGLVALIAGLGIGYWFARQGQELEHGKVEAAEAALADYKSKVNEHFATTAEHFKLIGQQYRDMYEHVADSAQQLMSEPEIEARGNPFLQVGLLPDASDPARQLETDTASTDEPESGEDATESDESVAAAEAEDRQQAEGEAKAADEAVADDTGEPSAEEPATKAEAGGVAGDAPEKAADETAGDDTAELPRLDPEKMAAADAAEAGSAELASDEGSAPEPQAVSDDDERPGTAVGDAPHPRHNGATNGAAGAPEVSQR